MSFLVPHRHNDNQPHLMLPFVQDPQLGLTVMSVTVSRMLLRLRRQALSDSAGWSSSQEELSTFRAASEGFSSSQAEVSDGS